MSNEELVKLAKQAGFETNHRMVWVSALAITSYLQRFANLVAESEREQCAELVETFDTSNPNLVAAAIRGRKD